MSPLVSIIVLSYNGCADTLACLRSLHHLTYPDTQVIVVDNASSDNSVAAIREKFPTLTLVESPKNLGFTGGNNLGIQRALADGAQYILLLNNDTIIAPDMIDEMVNACEAYPEVGIAGPTCYYYDVPDRVWSAGGEIDWRHGLTSMIGLNEDDRGQFGDEPRKVDFVTGCALLAKRAVWEKAGLLDDQFFMYYEETEWCVRAQRAGFQILHVPRAMLWHKISIEARAASARTYYYMTRNRLLFLNKTRAGFKTWFNTLGEYLRTFASWTVRPKWKDRAHLRWVMLQACKDYATGKLGQTAI